MTHTITFTVPGKPQAWQRPDGNGKRRYTAPKTRAYERCVGLAAKAVCKCPHTGPVRLLIVARFTIPKTWPKWKRAAALNGDLKHTVKPDGDNIAKAIKDGCNGIAYLDDSQVYRTTVHKTYCQDHEEPCVLVRAVLQKAHM